MWFWLWLLFVVALLLIPLGYGWGYRGWGAPYPSAYRRRGAVAAGEEDLATWGFLADVLWVVAIFALIWFFLALLL